MSSVSFVLSIALVSLVKGVSLYVVSTLVQPLSSDHQAYPIGVCVNYEVGVSGTTPILYWGVFACNTGGDEVTLTSYGQDGTCSTIDASIDATVFPYDAAIAAGEPGSFNCVGESNYVETEGCSSGVGAGDPETTCCRTDCIPNAQAIDVCAMQSTGVYTKVSCDEETGTTFTNHYTAAGCEESALDASARVEWDIEMCEYYKTVIIQDLWLRMRGCYIDGVADTRSVLCGTLDDNSTMSTTMMGDDTTTAITTAESDSGDDAVTFHVPFFTMIFLVMAFMLQYFY